MYGLIYTTVKDMVIKKLGEKVWTLLLEKANITHDFIETQNYPDEHVYTILEAGAKELNTTQEELLEAVGYWFIIYIKTTPYGKVLTMVGDNMTQILKNINTMHGHIKLGFFPDMHPPTFRCSQEKDTGLTLHYIPGRKGRVGLAPLIVGIVKALAETHLMLERFTIKQRKWIDKGAEEDVFQLRWAAQAKKDDDALSSGMSLELSHGLDASALDKAFPFHLMFNKKLEIIQAGKSLSKIVPLENGDLVTSYFEIAVPVTASFSSWKSLLQQARSEYFVLTHKYDEVTAFRLKGQMLWQPEARVLCFVGSPQLNSIAEANYLGLGLSDFSLHDPTKDTLFLNHATTTINSGTSVIAPPSAGRCPFSAAAAASRQMPAHAAAAPEPATPAGGSEENASLLSSLFGSRLVSTYHSKRKSGSASKKLPKRPSVPSLVVSSHQAVRKSSESSESSKDEQSREQAHSSAEPQLSPGEHQRSSTPSGGCRVEQAFVELFLGDARRGFQLTTNLLGMRGDAESELVFYAALDFFNHHGKAQQLMRKMLESEVRNAADESLLLRGESVPTRLLSLYLRREGREYCQRLISSLHRRIANAKPNNTDATLQVAQEFLEELCQSWLDCPAGVRRVLRILGEEVARRWPHMVQSSVCSLLLLRLLSPAILASAATLDGNAKRTVLLVTKMLQSLANGVALDGSKEDYMKHYGAFSSRANQQRLSSFVDQLTDEDFLQQCPQLGSQHKAESALMTLRDSVLASTDKLWLLAATDPHAAELFKNVFTVALCQLNPGASRI